jgi:hypothetical protein
MDLKVYWPFTLDNHDVDFNTEKKERLWIIVEKDNTDAILSSIHEDWSFIACWSNLWDASQQLDSLPNGDSFNIIDRDTWSLANEYRCLEIDYVPMLLNRVNGKPITLPTCYPTMMIYPNETMIWIYLIHKDSKEPLCDNDNVIYADTEPQYLLDTLLENNDAEHVANYDIVGQTLIRFATMFKQVNCRGHLFNTSNDMFHSKVMRRTIAERFNTNDV